MYESDYNYSYGDYSGVSQLDATATAGLATFTIVALLAGFAVTAIMIVSLWKLFVKAGRPGWAAIVPLYNTVVALEVAGRPWWWIALMFIPFANIVFVVIYMLDFVKSYGKDTAYAVLGIFLPFVVFPILAFSKDVKYVGPAGPEKNAVVSKPVSA